MMFFEIVRNEKIFWDELSFADSAFYRAKEALDVIWSNKYEFRNYLESELREMKRQKDYYYSMSRYYNNNVYRSRKFEALAFELMLQRFDKLYGY